ncbi:hypothetical protein JCM14469_27810 [Desulfatiferula olefinivorans]
MGLGPDPVFRKMIAAWYESEPACYILMTLMILVLLFGVAGVSVALTEPAYLSLVWVPGLLIVLAVLMILSCVFQLMNLYAEK